MYRQRITIALLIAIAGFNSALYLNASGEADSRITPVQARFRAFVQMVDDPRTPVNVKFFCCSFGYVTPFVIGEMLARNPHFLQNLESCNSKKILR